MLQKIIATAAVLGLCALGFAVLESEPAHARQGRMGNDRVQNVTYTIGAETSNAITVNVQVIDDEGGAIDESVALQQYLASDSACLTVEASAPTGTAAGTDGSLVVEYTAEVVWLANTESDGDLDIVVTLSSGADTFYLATVLPNGTIVCSSAITFAA